MTSQNHGSEPPIRDGSNPPLSYHDPHSFLGSSRIFGPQRYSEGVAFWYRPTEIDTISGIANQDPMRQSLSTATEHVKHRRTRSGCYTCRGRRVKVGCVICLLFESYS